MKVFIVDEEYHFAENVASALRFEGNEAVVFSDATEALDFFLANGKDIDPIAVRFLIDVSLAPGDDLQLFSREATDEFHRTGITLVKELLARRSGLCTGFNTTLYTAHFLTNLWDFVEGFCHQHGFKSWQKIPNADIEDLIKLIL